jgi:hypothetical protein
MGLGLEGAVAASVVGQVVTTVLQVPRLRHELTGWRGTQRVGVGGRQALLSLAALGGYGVLMSMDSVLARHYLPSREAGWYTAAATAGKIALFLPAAVATLAFPRFAVGDGRSREARSTLHLAFPAVLAIGLLAAVVMLGLSRLVMSLLFGASYHGAAGAVGILGVEAMLLGLVSLLVYFHLARRSTTSLLCWGGAVLAAVGIALFHRSPESIALDMVVASGATLAATLIATIRGISGHALAPEFPKNISLQQSGEGQFDFTVTTPVYNASPAVWPQVDEGTSTSECVDASFEGIVAADGFTDRSADILAGLRDVVQRVGVARNHGSDKGCASGSTKGGTVAWVPPTSTVTSRQTSCTMSPLSCMANPPDVMGGSKRNGDSQVSHPLLRLLHSLSDQLMLRGLFRVFVSDAQTGAKIARGNSLASVLFDIVERGSALKLALLVVARHLGFSRITQVSVHSGDRVTRTLKIQAKLRAVSAILLATTVITRCRLGVRRSYDRKAGRWQAVAPEPRTMAVNRLLLRTRGRWL